MSDEEVTPDEGTAPHGGDIATAPSLSEAPGFENTADAGSMGSGAPDASVSDGDGETKGTRKKRQARSFPAMSFDEALALPKYIQEHGAGQPIRRLTLFEAIQRSPDSSASRQLITSSGQYNLTTGGYRAETLALTPKGAIASDPAAPDDRQLRARFDLAIAEVTPFQSIYERYVGNRLPTVEVLRDAARDADVPDEYVAEAVETFLANAREVGLIRSIAGSEHLISIDAAAEMLEGQQGDAGADDRRSGPADEKAPPTVATAHAKVDTNVTPRAARVAEDDLSNVCFVVSPIGDADSIERKHADLILSAFIEPALKDLGMVAVRADKISKPGLITGQVIDHIARAKLVIADLSFGNPNVYYELALRQATRKPVLQLIRRGDKLPFDVIQFRTVEIDMSDIYALVPQIDLHRQEITRQARAAINEGNVTESPLSQFYPSFWDYIASDG